MQALIDFDGWRKWKDFSQAPQANLSSGKQPSPSGKNALSPSGAKNVASGVNGTPVKGGGKKNLVLNTGQGAKKEKRLSSSGENGSSGSGSEGSGHGSTITAGA